MHTTDPLTVGEIARRSGFAESAVRYYEGLGLLPAARTAGRQRRFERSTLRRLAFIRAARNVGLSLDDQIRALTALRDGLDSCIGCGCLSLQRCAISNPGDAAGAAGPGAAYLPAGLRRGDGRLAGPPGSGRPGSPAR